MRYAPGALLLSLFVASCGVSDPAPTAYLLSVATVPTSQAATGGFDTFDIALNTGADSNTKAMSFVPPSAQAWPLSAAPDVPHAKAWAARMAWESKRHADASAPILRDARAPRSWRGKMRVAPTCTASSDCTGMQMCWKGQCTANPNLFFVDGTALPCDLVNVANTAQGTSINVLVDHNAVTSLSPAANANLVAAINTAVAAFAGTFDLELQLLGQTGHTGAVDRDNDGRFTVVFTNATGPGLPPDAADLVGFFSVSDFLTTGTRANGTQADGNEADIMWVRVPDPNNPQPQLIAGTIAHEYTHLTSYALRVYAATQSTAAAALGQEELWLDEGTAHLMEDLTGWGSSTVRVTEQALQKWTSAGVLAGPDDSLIQRGEAYLLLRWLVDTAAKKAGATSASDSATTQAAATFVSALLRENKLGWQHSNIAALGATGMGQWLQAVYTTGLTAANASEAHAYDFLPVGTSSLTGIKVGIDPYATFKDTDNADVVLQGPETIALDASSADISSEVSDSGSALYTVTGFDATHARITSQVDAAGGPFLDAVPTEVAK